jgi:hypothetical protein
MFKLLILIEYSVMKFYQVQTLAYFCRNRPRIRLFNEGSAVFSALQYCWLIDDMGPRQCEYSFLATLHKM